MTVLLYIKQSSNTTYILYLITSDNIKIIKASQATHVHHYKPCYH